MDFSQGAGQQTSSDVIPNGQLAWAIINVRAVKPSNSGGQYIDVELTLDDGQPFARRKIWEMIGDPMHAGNSDAYRQMGQVAIARILEAGRGAGPNNPGAYNLRDYVDLSGLRVPIRVGIIPEKDGYPAKNRVGEWLTPNPASGSGYKDFEKLMNGVTNASSAKTAMKQAPASGFGAQPTAAGTQPGFGGQATQPGFSNAQPQGNQQWGGGAQTAATPSQQTAAAGASPSNDGTPNWLAQANGQ